ncbi:unnamed protein product [Rotaria magnacalcarata]|uniref:Uncharacterized protein n=3 Tax=Rotaria magnacalcarata TaxID=392030 RepID=A0A816T369_9BILA|nr:unnamed protein product [Rotaria magnacalcarata]CAF2135475.1 unnamed protein product [Rotaria magnacalcarata]CAF2250559.1 unnamed protein product [Rotaria magnacalcarata]CAF4026150.1 unnamed protein product [Rotaria magnacalcarata]CAF4075870.1 unnamed protein product [Rotaria magnacalcarata]
MYQVTIFVLCFIAIEWIQASKIVDTKTITEKQDHDVVLVCRFEQLNKGDRVMWSKDSVILSVNDEIAGDRKRYEIIDKYNLMIKTVAEQDSGKYLCQNFDQRVSMNIILTILTRPSKPDIQQANKSLIENHSGKFLCITQGGYPPPTFTWLINQIKINESFYNVRSDTRQSYSELNLPMEKRFHNGLLTCHVENQALDTPLITTYTLNIEYKPEVRLRHGQKIVSNSNLLVVEDDRMTLQCEAESNPPILKPVAWLKNNISLSDMNSSSLILSNIKRNDDGVYTCLASNAIGHSQSSVHIRVQYSPMIHLDGGGSINENEKLTLTCRVDAYPSIDYYQWYKNHQKLNTSSLTSSIVIEKVSKEDSGIYICMVKNTLNYFNGSSIEKYNKTQTKVTVNYAPKVRTFDSIVAVDLLTTNVKFQCEIDSYPESIVTWRFNNNNVIFNSNKYSIVQNKSLSYLTIQQIQSNTDYGLYSCNATNNLGYNSTTIQLRSKAIPESPTDLNVTNIDYSAISLKWKPGFDGGWPQSFWISLDNSIWKETNQTFYTFTNLQHLEYYNITVRAYNELGQSSTVAFLRVQTKDVPVRKEDLPNIEHSSLELSEKLINYRLNDSSFMSIKVPLCIRIEIDNETNICERIVTSSGVLRFNENNLNNNINLSICISQYENYCGESIPVQIKRDTSFNWVFLVLSSIITVALLILCGLGIFCFLTNRKQQRNTNLSRVIASDKAPSQNQVISTKPVIPTTNSPTKYFSNVTYPERQQVQLSYGKLAEIQKFDQLQGNIVNNRQLSNGSSDPILSNPNSSSLSGSDHLTITDMNPTDVSSIENDLHANQSQYLGYGFPIYTGKNKEDSAESGCSTPLKSYHLNKKTVYEVVV